MSNMTEDSTISDDLMIVSFIMACIFSVTIDGAIAMAYINSNLDNVKHDLFQNGILGYCITGLIIATHAIVIFLFKRVVKK